MVSSMMEVSWTSQGPEPKSPEKIQKLGLHWSAAPLFHVPSFFFILMLLTGNMAPTTCSLIQYPSGPQPSVKSASRAPTASQAAIRQRVLMQVLTTRAGSNVMA